MKPLNGFLMTRKQMTLKDMCGYIMLENFFGHVSDVFLAYTVNTI